jgi:predicted small metal-binding protein
MHWTGTLCVWYIYSPEAGWSTRGGAVTHSFRCKDGGVVCSTEVTGETEAEVLAKAVAHARDAHGVDVTDSTTLSRYAQSLIRDDGSPA